MVWVTWIICAFLAYFMCFLYLYIHSLLNFKTLELKLEFFSDIKFLYYSRILIWYFLKRPKMFISFVICYFLHIKNHGKLFILSYILWYIYLLCCQHNWLSLQKIKQLCRVSLTLRKGSSPQSPVMGWIIRQIGLWS